MSCFDCAKFNKKQKICTEHHMGDKPKWMGCSWWEDPDKNLLTLFEEEDVSTK